MKQSLAAAVAAAVLVLGSASAQAANVSFTGNLYGANDVQLFTFTLAANSNVTLRTWSYAGGVNAAGNAIARGGFDPVLSLFAGLGSSAILIGGNDDGFGVATDPVSGFALDSLASFTPLLAGTYTVSLSEVANFANGPTLGDGFLGFGNPGFDGRSGRFALDILGVTSATLIPAPSTLALSLLGLAIAGVGMSARRRSASNQ